MKYFARSIKKEKSDLNQQTMNLIQTASNIDMTACFMFAIIHICNIHVKKSLKTHG